MRIYFVARRRLNLVTTCFSNPKLDHPLTFIVTRRTRYNLH